MPRRLTIDSDSPRAKIFHFAKSQTRYPYIKISKNLARNFWQMTKPLGSNVCARLQSETSLRFLVPSDTPRGHSVRRAAAMFALGASAGCAAGGARPPPRDRAEGTRARCRSARPWTRAPTSGTPRLETSARSRARRLSPAAARGDAPGGFGNFGDFERDRARDGADDLSGVPGDRDADDIPTASGDFSRKLSLELSKRGVTRDFSDLEPRGELEPAEPALREKSLLKTEGVLAERDRSQGLLSDMRAERGRSRLGVWLTKRFGAGSQYLFALSLAVAIWHAPSFFARFFNFVALNVPTMGAFRDAFVSFQTLGVGFNPLVAAACAAATFKIVLLCVVVKRLIETDRLPKETPVVLSKLAFNVCLPTYMCTRVAATLNATPLTLGLAVLPVCAVAQVCFGGCMGALLMTCARSVPGLVARAWRGEASGPGASAVAEGVARAVGNAGVAGAIAPNSNVTVRPHGDGDDETASQDTKKTGLAALAAASASSSRSPMDRIGVACCAFGNTFTLPIVFLVEVLGAAFGDRVAGYVALYLIGWSPTLWTVGYVLITGAAGPTGNESSEASDSGKKESASERFAFIAKEVCNPPMIGICLGVLIGCTPLRHVLIGGTPGSIALSNLPLEVSACFAAFRCAFELAALVGGAALPVQTLILASSFAKKKSFAEPKSSDETTIDDEKRLSGASLVENANQKSLPMASETFGVRFTRSASGAFVGASRKIAVALRAALALDDVADARALLVASSVRFFFLPLVGVIGCLALKAANSPWYPSDPVVAMVGLTMSAMPPAQNMVLLTNLSERTRSLAPRVGGLLVRMYVLAVAPCTLWLTVFKAAVMA
jgi:predicted permease